MLIYLNLLLFFSIIVSNYHFAVDAIENAPNFYSSSVRNAVGELVDLSRYKGKISLVTNVASECGYTDTHYKMYQRLQAKYGPTGYFNILAFPCNQFGAQEHRPIAEIVRWAEKAYNVNFPIFAKINVVKNYDLPEEDSPPAVWKYLTDLTMAPNWNFWKYLVDHHGNLVEYFNQEASEKLLEEYIEVAILTARQGSIVHDEI